MTVTVAQLMEALVYMPPHEPVVIYYDGRYEAPIEEVRVATEEERTRSKYGAGVIVQVYT